VSPRFYAMVRTTQPPGTTRAPGAVVHICDDVACIVAGADALCAEMTRRFGREGTVNTEGPGAHSNAPASRGSAPVPGKCDRGPPPR